MPKRTDISTILIIGAGPIVIGQACEFDYSGDAGLQGAAGGRLPDRPGQFQSGHDHDRSRHGRPDLYRADHAGDRRARSSPRSAMRSRAASRCCRPWAARRRSTARWRCARWGVLEKYDVEMIGATAEAIDKAEDRELFREAMTKIGLETPRSHQVKTLSAGADRARRHRLARDHPPELHHGRHRRRHRLHHEANSSRSSSAASTPRRPTRC